VSILEVKNVSIRYITGDFKDIGLKEYVMRRLKHNYHVREFWADRDITFTLEKGDMLGIIGTNGAGKSTLLKAISGIMEPTKGRVTRQGTIAALLELASGFDGDLTVRENAYLRGAMLGYTRKFMDETYEKIIDFAELRDFQDRPFKQLSSGMKSRLAFAIASLVQPDILILDEVLSVGDGAFRKKSEAKMREIIRGGATTILVSHSIQQVRELCNKVLWLEKGEQIAFGSAEVLCDLYQKYLDHSMTLEQIKSEIALPLCSSGKETAKKKRAEKRDQINDGLERYKRKKGKVLLLYTLLFLCTFVLAYSPFLREGKSFIWSAYDGWSQHYPALVYIGRYLRNFALNFLHGEWTIPLFDLNLSMGADVIATLNYYGFGNPLYLLSAIVPTHYTEYLYSFLIVVRLYLAGIAFLAFCSYYKKPYTHAIIGSLVYVFSGYAVFSAVRHPYFIEPMIQLPLLLIGIDLIIKRKKPFVFIAVVFYSALCGFYFLYMMTIMAGVYALIRFFDVYKEKRLKEFAAMAKRIMGTYLLGIGLGAPIFIPAVIGYLTSARAEMTVKRNYLFYGFNYYFNNFLDMIAPPGSWDAFSLAAIVWMSLVILLFLSPKKHRNLKWLLAIGGVFYLIPLGGHIMNGFGYPSQRWTFGLTLLLSYILVEMLPVLLTLDRKQQLVCFSSFLFYGFIVFYAGKNRTAYHVFAVAMLAGTLLVLILFGGAKEERKKRIGAIACILLVIVNVGINGIYRFSKEHANYISDFKPYGSETKRLETVREREAEPYLKTNAGRFDSTGFYYNLGAVWKVPIPHYYWSICTPVSPFLGKMENTNMSALHTIAGVDKRTGLEALVSTKYLIESKNGTQPMPFGYSLVEETENGNLIYENQYALPWGYTYDSYITLKETAVMSGLEMEEALRQSILLEENIAGFAEGRIESNILELPYKIAKLNDVEWQGDVLTAKKDKATIALEFSMPQNVEGFVRLVGFDMNNSGYAKIYLSAKCGETTKSIPVLSTKDNWYWERENYLINFGFSDYERTTCTITFPKKGEFRLNDIQVLVQPMDKYPEQIEALRDEPLKNIEFGVNQISGTVNLTRNKILCLSIPYSKGWTAKVDGQKTRLLKGNYAFIALPLEAGHHDIVFTYFTPGLKVGLGCFAISFIVVILLRRKYKRSLKGE